MSVLFTPIRLGGLEIPNRIMRSATWEGMAQEDGTVTDALVELYERLGAGGAGLVISGYAYICPEGKGLPRQVAIYDDRYVEGLSRIADAVHRGGGLAIVQLVHAGGQTNSRTTGQDEVLAPSAVPYASHEVTPREMTAEEARGIVRAHGEATRRAMEAGFDGVQLHAAHGYLVNRFLSPAFNRRQDEYGGSILNRARFGVEAIEACRGALGDGKVLSIKLNSQDNEEGGLSLGDAVEAAKLFVTAGVDHVEVSGGTPMSGELGAARQGIVETSDEAYFRPGAARIKGAIDAPVGLVGGIRSFDVAEDIVTSGDADTVSLARPFICEPALPSRWKSGDRDKSICTSDGGCFVMGIKKGIRCAVHKS